MNKKRGVPIKIRDPKGFLKTGGYLSLKKTGRSFYKPVNRAKHYMNIVKGYGIQKELFDKYLRGKKGVIKIHEKDTGRWLIASVKTWTEHSRAGNYGDGKQIFLSERFMHNSDDFDREETVCEAVEKPKSKQLSL